MYQLQVTTHVLVDGARVIPGCVILVVPIVMQLVEVAQPACTVIVIVYVEKVNAKLVLQEVVK